jgi:hypothetical protein
LLDGYDPHNSIRLAASPAKPRERPHRRRIIPQSDLATLARNTFC